MYARRLIDRQTTVFTTLLFLFLLEERKYPEILRNTVAHQKQEFFLQVVFVDISMNAN